MTIARLVLVLSLFASTARADATKHRDAGVAAYKAGNYPLAIREFEAAYAQEQDPDLLFSLAQAERLGGKCPSALRHYRMYLDSKPSAQGVDLGWKGIEACLAPPPPPPKPVEKPVIVPQPVPADETPWYRDPTNYVITAGGITLGLGVGYMIASGSSRDGALDAEFSDRFDNLLDQATLQRRIGVGALIVGAALVGGGLGYRLYRDREAKTAVVATDGRGLYVAGTF
jgi:hypothetical protein